MDGLALAAALVVMGAIVTGLIALYQASASPRNSLQRRLGTILGETEAYEAIAVAHEALRPKKVGRVPIISALLEGKSWTEEMAAELEKADIRLTVSEFVALRGLLGLSFAIVPAFALGATTPGVPAMVVAAIVGYFLPGFYLKFAKGRRVSKLDHQLIEALSLISNSLKAGFGLLQSFDLASKQLEHPIATELRRTLYDINVGSSTDAALMALAKRSGSNDLDIVVTAMLIQQSTGGNLGEILDNVGHTMRERIRIKGEITTLTSQQMLTGLIIGALPVCMAAAFTLISPGYMDPLFETNIGRMMIAGAGMLELFGIFVIKQILAIEV